jgi:hypothetical protein
MQYSTQLRVLNYAVRLPEVFHSRHRMMLTSPVQVLCWLEPITGVRNLQYFSIDV